MSSGKKILEWTTQIESQFRGQEVLAVVRLKSSCFENNYYYTATACYYCYLFVLTLFRDIFSINDYEYLFYNT